MRARRHVANAQVRDSDYLRWRFRQSPFAFDLLEFRSAGRLVGYVATVAVDHSGGDGLRHTVIVDWLFDPEVSTNISAALLCGVLARARAAGADLVSAVVHQRSPFMLPFKRYGFFRRSRYMPVMFHANDIGREVLADQSAWHFTLADTDAF
jgi:hypothetical protein